MFLAVVEVRLGDVHRNRIDNRTCSRNHIVPSKFYRTLSNSLDTLSIRLRLLMRIISHAHYSYYLHERKVKLILRVTCTVEPHQYGHLREWT